MKATRKNILLATGVIALAAWASGARADDRATKEQAVAMVKKAVTFIKANGPEKSYAAISDKANTDFHDRDLYVVVYDLQGHCLAHGANSKMIGKDFSEAQDVDGVYYMKDRIKLAQSKTEFWQDYKFTNPVSKKIEPKQMYCQRLNDTAVCGGIYK